MRRLAILPVVLWFAAVPVAAQQAEPPADPQPATGELEELVETLKDPAARERLVGDLEQLLEAQRAAAADAAAAEDTGLLDVVKNLADEVWDSVTSIDPREVAISSTISVGILIAAVLLRWLVLTLLRRLYARLIRKSTDDGDETAEATRVELPTPLRRLLNLIIAVLAIALIAESWGGGLSELLQTDIGARIAETALAVGLILVITLVLWNAAELLVERLLMLGTRKHDRDRTARRLGTLVPLLTSVLQTTISVMAVLLILSELGVNIGPLLAGAGIVGLAVGFGAQTLVKDLITGVTILLEDGATVGDVVEVAGHAGVVEEMRVRIMQLRDLSGNVHLVPYGEVTTIKNFTKDWSCYLFDVGVAYREDTDRVCEVLTGISEEMQSDEVHGASILEPLEILGVDRFADSAVIVRARLKTAPGSQWAVGREFNRRIKKRFDEEGIEIPFPHTTVFFGEPKEGTAPPMQLALAGDSAARLLDRGRGD